MADAFPVAIGDLTVGAGVFETADVSPFAIGSLTIKRGVFVTAGAAIDQEDRA